MEWISVEKELPPKGEIVLLFKGNEEMTIGGFSKEIWVNYYGKRCLECGSLCYSDNPVYVTHWMSLPEGPNAMD